MVRCGIIGCGNVVEEMHLPVLGALPGVRLEAVCDTDPERLRAFVARYAVSRPSTNLEAFLGENKDLDFIIVATPGYTHYEVVKRLLEARVPIFVEKPLSLNFAEAVDLQKRAQDLGVKVCVGQTWRFRDPVLRAKDAQERGLVGKIYQVNVVHHGESSFHCSAPPWAWEEREHKILLYEHAIHLLDLQVCFAGPIRELLVIKAIQDKHLRATTQVYALVEHESGAIGIVDLQLFSSSNFTHFEAYGTANDIQIKFFPHSYRLYSGRVNPVDELYHEFLRMKDFVWPVVKAKIRRPMVPRRALPHFRMLKEFVRAVADDSARVPVAIEDVLPTMSYLDQLSKAVYG